MFLTVFAGEETVSLDCCPLVTKQGRVLLPSWTSRDHPVSWHVHGKLTELSCQAQLRDFGPSTASALHFDKRGKEKCICSTRNFP